MKYSSYSFGLSDKSRGETFTSESFAVAGESVSDRFQFPWKWDSYSFNLLLKSLSGLFEKKNQGGHKDVQERVGERNWNWNTNEMSENSQREVKLEANSLKK